MTPRFAALLGAALLLRIIAATFPGYAFDREYFTVWAQTLATHGPLAIYRTDLVPRVDYTPGYLYVLWAIGLVHAAIGGGAATWRVLLEVVPIASDLALIVLLYRYARRIASESRAFALAAIAAFAPPLWFDSALWGQADALPIALALIGLLGASDGRFAGAWPALVAAILVKPLSAVIAPVFGVLQLAARSPWRGLAVSVVASLALAYVITAPFTPERGPLDVFRFLLQRYENGANKAPLVTVGAFTVYPLLTGFTTPDASRFGALSFQLWGIIAVLVGLGAASWTLARSLAKNPNERTKLARILGAACLSSLALFLFATRMHERYLLPGLAIGAPLGLEDRPTALALGWLAISFTIDCAFVMAGFSGDGHHPATIAIGRLCSAANIAAFATLWQRQLRRLA